ncbi:MAG TPA: cytochrome C [Acidobacteria bacterium]|jgi:hypothetical protein|nr:cytochrome C [Acidobacteriota bacterium]
MKLKRSHCTTVIIITLAVVLVGSASAVLSQQSVSESQNPTAEVAPSGLEAPGLARDAGGQPIAFSHAHHAGQYQIECEFCHAYARRGPVAGIPSVERCVGCHQSILTDQPEIQKLLEYWENEEPIPWLRIHDLPDYVRFTHKAHVRAGINCENCHGDVRSMDIAQQVESLSMGWCLDCHNEREAPRDCLICHY